MSRLDAADPVLDAQARAAYRRRLGELEEDLEVARSWSAAERAAHAAAAIDALTGSWPGRPASAATAGRWPPRPNGPG